MLLRKYSNIYDKKHVLTNKDTEKRSRSSQM
jgi:hypothetical protein